MANGNREIHLDVYENRCELHQGDKVRVYYEGLQNETAQKRYEKINEELRKGYLDRLIGDLGDIDYAELSEGNKELISNLIEGVTSEVGRALVGVTFLQLTIKAICPEQSVRLHKGATRRGSFSWEDGISMRTIDSNYSTPFLRKYGLLNVNKFGVFMTRSLAENYPYSKLYKADMRGPFNQWIKIVDSLEDGLLPPKLGLCYMTALMKNRSDAFKEMAEKAIELAKQYHDLSFDGVKKFMISFVHSTEYAARAFEVVIHGFMQAMYESGMLESLDLVPMSQMRSANKKHGNVGDVELREGRVVVEAWDAKYGKPYLRDELEELRDKLFVSPDVKIAGFIVDRDVDRRKEVMRRAAEIETETGVAILLLSFTEWLDYQTKSIVKLQLNEIGKRWMTAVVESFAQRRREMAPIDEPCEAWIQDLIEKLK